jgi:hypothetical protein
MRKGILPLLFLALALAGIASAFIFYSFYLIVDVRTFPMDAQVSNHNSFNLTSGTINFGKITSPGWAGRSIYVDNKNDFPVQVDVSATNEFKKWLYINSSSFRLEPGENRVVYLELNMPKDIPENPYKGTLRVVITRILFI